MRILLTLIRGLVMRYGKTDLNHVANSVYVGNITLKEAVTIYQLNVRELRFVANMVNEYYMTDQYVQPRIITGETNYATISS